MQVFFYDIIFYRAKRIIISNTKSRTCEKSSRLTTICAVALSFKFSVLLIRIVSNNSFLNLIFISVQLQVYNAKLIESFWNQVELSCLHSVHNIVIGIIVYIVHELNGKSANRFYWKPSVWMRRLAGRRLLFKHCRETVRPQNVLNCYYSTTMHGLLYNTHSCP